MKRLWRYIYCLTALVSLLALASAGCKPPADTSIQTRLQEMLTTKYAAFKSTAGLPENAGILVYLITPKGSWLATAGLPVGADENWHYRIASVSKTFTAASIMLLDQQGKLKIDDVLTAKIPGTSAPYLPDSPNYAIPYKDRITIRQLLTHRAGIFDVFNTAVPVSSNALYAGKDYGSYIKRDLGESDHQFTNDELAWVISVNKLSSNPPETEYKYSDTGYTLLAKIIQRVSGRSYDRFLADNFLTPMGLTQTFSPWSAYDNQLPSPFFKGYSNMGAGYFETTEDNMSDQVGPGNIISTPSDIARWMGTLLSGRGPLTKEQVKRMTTVPTGNSSYALGISKSGIGLGHSGAHPGYVNLAGYNSNDDVTVVVVSPFIDYNGLGSHLTLLTEVGKEARTIAGYTEK
jgi:D-alanyl-D-alanine carboxypeptidase